MKKLVSLLLALCLMLSVLPACADSDYELFTPSLFNAVFTDFSADTLCSYEEDVQAIAALLLLLDYTGESGTDIGDYQWLSRVYMGVYAQDDLTSLLVAIPAEANDELLCITIISGTDMGAYYTVTMGVSDDLVDTYCDLLLSSLCTEYTKLSSAAILTAANVIIEATNN